MQANADPVVESGCLGGGLSAARPLPIRPSGFACAVVLRGSDCESEARFALATSVHETKDACIGKARAQVLL
jgi:hypothetical protein